MDINLILGFLAVSVLIMLAVTNLFYFGIALIILLAWICIVEWWNNKMEHGEHDKKMKLEEEQKSSNH